MIPFNRHLVIHQRCNVKRQLYNILLFGFLLLVVACENPKLSLDDYTPSLVVISNFTTQHGIQVQVSKTHSPLDNKRTEYITNAKVEIWESGQLLETLHLNDTRESDVPFYTSEVLKPRIGLDYTIKVSAPGYKTVTATSRIPERVNLDSVKIENLVASEDDPGYKLYKFDLAIYFTDPRMELNFYHVNVFQKNIVSLKDSLEYVEQVTKLIFDSKINTNYIVANYDGGFLIEDKPIDGSTLRIPIPITLRLPAHVQNLDELIVELRSVSQEYYMFHSTVSRQQSNENMPISDPVVLYNNILNGQGVFAGYSQAEKAIKIYPQ